MKVALVCNMNNNYFSLMRYLRNAGIDAHLFRLADENNLWSPANDTWHIEKWEAYIHTLPFTYYHYSDILDFDKKAVFDALKDFDLIIGSGPSPAYLSACGLKVDLFWPYRTGVEYSRLPLNWKRPRQVWGALKLIKAQKEGLKKAKAIITLDFRPITHDYLKQLGVPICRLNVPMVFPEKAEFSDLSIPLKAVINRIKEQDFSVFNCSRHYWLPIHTPWYKRLAGFNYLSYYGNDQLIRGFARFVKESGCPKALLLQAEVGGHVKESKALIKELDIQDKVLWFPTSPRKEILEMLRHTTISTGEFHGGGFGGKVFEALSQGRPVINTMGFTNEEYLEQTGTPLPPVIKAESEDDIFNALMNAYRNKEQNETVGRVGKEWFDTYDGIGLANKLIDLIGQLHQGKTRKTTQIAVV